MFPLASNFHILVYLTSMEISNMLLSSQNGFVAYIPFLIVIVVIFLKLKGILPLGQESVTTNKYRNESDFFFTKELLIFTTHIILIDGKVSKQETEYVNKFLFREYGKRKQKKFAGVIADYIKNGYNFDLAVRRVNNKCDMSSKLQLLHFLIKVAIVDGYLTDTEYAALSKITQKFNLTYHQLNSILAMYKYTSEKAQREQKKSESKKTTQGSYALKRALMILELDVSASDDQIKKSYRKLVNLHHPDKVLHLDAVQKKSSKEKFLKISEAYELLKSNRKFK